MKKIGKILTAILCAGTLLLLTACECRHEWVEATCTKPKTCTKSVRFGRDRSLCWLHCNRGRYPSEKAYYRVYWFLYIHTFGIDFNCNCYHCIWERFPVYIRCPRTFGSFIICRVFSNATI